MRLTDLALATPLSVAFGTCAQAQTCGEFCTPEFWERTTPAEISKAIAAVDGNARDKDGTTPFPLAAWFGTPKNILTLLEAGAVGTVNNKDGKTSFDLAKDNDKLQDPDAYWALNDVRFK